MTSLRTKLTALLAVPLLVLVVVAGIGFLSTSRQAREARTLARRIQLSVAASNAALQLSHERHLSVSALSVPEGGSLPDELAFQRGKTTEAVDALRRLAGSPDRLHSLQHLGTTRDAVDLRRPSTDQVFQEYAALIDPVLDLDRTSQAVDDARLAAQLDAHHALTRAIQDVAHEQSLIASALSAKQVSPTTYDHLVEVVSNQALWLDIFQANATPSQEASYREVAAVPAMATAERLRLAVLAAGPAGTVDGQGLEVWSNAMGRKIDLLETLAEDNAAALVTQGAVQQIIAGRRQLVSVGLLLATLVLALVLLLLLRRSVIRPIRRLVTAARDAANRTLPAAVELARKEGGDAVRRVFAPLEIPRQRELGELATAFNTVQEATATLAADEAMLKGNADAVFLHFGRRTQSLVTRQLGHIDDLESRTDDPDTLADLFLLDHLATRLRRNAESLVVLAGDDSPRPWARPVTVVNVVRAAVAEAADYSRVDVESMARGSVAGSSANDVSHLLAELVDNALAFSPPDSRVTIAGEWQTDGRYLMTVTDAGPGMSAAQMALANKRMSRSTSPDPELGRHFGLFVVGRLAQRHGIEVQLMPARPRGIEARVLLPPALMAGIADVTTPSSPNGAPADGGAGGNGGGGSRRWSGRRTGPAAPPASTAPTAAHHAATTPSAPTAPASLSALASLPSLPWLSKPAEAPPSAVRRPTPASATSPSLEPDTTPPVRRRAPSGPSWPHVTSSLPRKSRPGP